MSDLKSATERLNSDVVRVRSKAKLEKYRLTKDYKKEIKELRKEHGHELQRKRKLEKFIRKDECDSRIFATF